MKNVICEIEHHAVLYGLFAREAAQAGIRGRCTLGKATAQYGRERGRRMAAYAAAEGIEPSMPAYSLFKEWRPPRPGMMAAGEAISTPEYATSVCRCEWVETWKKYGLLEYGKTYCLYVDKNLVKGFQPELELDIPALQSLGDPCCTFNWGYEKNDSIAQWQQQKQAEIGEKYVRDFNFHTAHLYGTMCRIFQEELKEQGVEICSRAAEEFASIFGPDYLTEIQQIAKDNQWFMG